MYLMKKSLLALSLTSLIGASQLSSQVSVSVNFNIKHEVGGVSDFGRERHITVHSTLGENDWTGEYDKMDYLMNDLDVYFGRDNGSSNWRFKSTKPQTDPNKMPDYFTSAMQEVTTFGVPDLEELKKFGTWNKEQYGKIDEFRLGFQDRAREMICGTQPHPTYPTLAWHDGAMTETSPKWRPLVIETTTDWVTNYLDYFFAKNDGEQGEPLPKYWEVINEPDMVYMTGAGMNTSLEELFRYHNLVADGVRERLGANAPLIGGMTWGLHDLNWADPLGRYYPASCPNDYHPALKEAFYKATKTKFEAGRSNPFYQWDAMWKGFMDASGDKMDFYSIHIYDWINWDTYKYSNQRTGGATEAILDMVDWYQNFKYGKSKDIIISEYGAIVDQSKLPKLDMKFADWSNVRSFSNMMMQFLERPDIIKKSMPFAPIKATWVDYKDDQGTLHRYGSTMMDNNNGTTDWEWRENIKFYELWSEVKGTRVDTKASDRDIQVDAYVDGKTVYLILNSLELNNKTVGLSYFGDQGNAIKNVSMKRLFLDKTLGANGQPVLQNISFESAPTEVIMNPEETLIVKYTFEKDVNINETSKEKKYYSQALNGGVEPYREKSDKISTKINGVTVPALGEATLRIAGAWHKNYAMTKNAQNLITINGHKIVPDMDWRGNLSNQEWFGVMEIDVPLEYLKDNNDVDINIIGGGTFTCVSLQVWNMSITPGRETKLPIAAIGIPKKQISAEEFSKNSGGLVKDGKVEQFKNGSWLEYNVKALIAGDYDLKFYYASGVNNNQLKVYVDDNTTPVLTADIPSSGGWNSFKWSSISKVNFTKGLHTLRFQVAGDVLLDDFYLNIDGSIPVESVSLNTSSLTIEPGKKATMIATVKPMEADDTSVKWSSSDEKIFTVDAKGNITGVTEGKATLTVTTNSGNKIATCEVTVAMIKVSAVEINPASKTIAVGNRATLAALVSPSNATDPSVKWTSSDLTIATVDENGVVTGKKAGKVTITATAVHGGIKGEANVTIVFNDIASIFIKPSSIGLKVNDKQTLSVSIMPEDASDKTINWVSSNPSVVSIDENGFVTAKAIGSATITATTSNLLSAECKVSVIDPNGVITIQAEDLTSTGGSVDDSFANGPGLGFNINGTVINYGNGGDWAEYNQKLIIANEGYYQFTYIIACPSNGATAKLSIPAISFTSTTNIPNNNAGTPQGWDKYNVIVAPDKAYLTPGTYTIKIEAGGPMWAWNLDKIEVVNIGSEIPSGIRNIARDIKISPNPANEVLNISGLSNEVFKARIINSQGVEVLMHNNSNTEINISHLPQGLYILQIITDNKEVKNIKFQKVFHL